MTPVRSFRTNGRGRGTIRWPTSACRRFHCFSCSRSRSFPISVRSKKDARPRIAIPCSAWRKFRRTITSVRCSTRFIPRICNPRSIDARGGMKDFERLGGRALIALDGTEYFCSQKLGCPQCQTRKRSNGKTEFYHSMLAATLVAPGHNMVVPLMPEFIAKPDGAEKQDCERNAAKRWLAAHGARVRELRPVYLGDDLFAYQPICEAALANGADFLFTAKPDSHKTLYDFMNGATFDEVSQLRKEGGKKLTYRYRWFSEAPLRDGKDALSVNWIGLAISDAKGRTTYEGAFVTSLEVSRETVAEIAACARARWKIENESFNILKNNGYHLEHNFGHGKQNLAMLFAAMNLLAFAMHTVCDCLEDLWVKAREAKRSRKRFFEHIRTITAYLVFPDWRSLMTTLINSKPPPEIEKQIAG